MSQENSEETPMEQQSNIAFNDFKASVTNDEFVAILALAKEEYNKLSRAYNAIKSLEQESDEGIEMIKKQSMGMPPGLAEKLILGLKRRANKDFSERFEAEIKRHVSVTDFLNRFQLTGEMLDYLNFNETNTQEDGNI